MPGIIDAHVHLRDPGLTYKEDFTTGTKAALAGGVVAVLDMPNNPQPTITLKKLQQKEKLAAKKCVCDYRLYFGASNSNWNSSACLQKASKKTLGLKIYMDHTTGPLLIEDLKILENHFKNWPASKPILVHAEGGTLAKAIGLAFSFNKWLHVCHVSTESELEIVTKAKSKGLKITCEVTPHHLFLTNVYEESLKGFAAMRPPLGTKDDLKALWWGLNHDKIDYIATDHAPHTKKEKQSSKPPFGVPGLETMLPLMLTAVYENKLSLRTLIRLVSTNSANIHKISLKNSWIEVDFQKKWQINNKNLHTKCGWSPFDGFKVKGKVINVYLRNKKVFSDGEVLVKKGFGIKI
ncbi:amidohydrolase family protein [Patescibacteria group bacterium]